VRVRGGGQWPSAARVGQQQAVSQTGEVAPDQTASPALRNKLHRVHVCIQWREGGGACSSVPYLAQQAQAGITRSITQALPRIGGPSPCPQRVPPPATNLFLTVACLQRTPPERLPTIFVWNKGAGNARALEVCTMPAIRDNLPSAELPTPARGRDVVGASLRASLFQGPRGPLTRALTRITSSALHVHVASA
jgi:hypothetical protein